MGRKGKYDGHEREFIGKTFGRLTITDIQPHIRKSGKVNGLDAVCLCSCGKTVNINLISVVEEKTKSCGCLQKEKARSNIKQALKWNEEHPEEMKVIREKGVSSMLKWQKENPKEAKEQKKEAVNRALLWRKEHPEEVKKYLDQAHEWQREHSEEFKEYLDYNIEQAHKWNEEHPEEMKAIREKGITSMQKWKDENPELSKEISQTNMLKAHLWNKEHPKELLCRVQRGKKQFNLDSFSKEEKELYSFLCTLGYNVERQVLVENHYFDFKINNFLIEYNGSTYHYTEYNNLENPNSKEPPSHKKDKDYHVELRRIALRNNYNLIQVWDFDWQNRKEFIKNLIKDQLSGIINYKDYIEDNLLNNDYGFNVDGVQIDPRSIWVSTGSKNIVNESFIKSRVLIYNSGFTKVVS